jgi:hypothetical protein
MFCRAITILSLYVALVTGLSALIIEIGTAIAHGAAGELVFAEKEISPVSRVEQGLEMQARVASWQPEPRVIEVRALELPELPANALAHSMDVAERSTVAEHSTERTTLPAVTPKAGPPKIATAKPTVARAARVAGWSKRVKARPRHDVEECTARIIERNLKAEI